MIHRHCQKFLFLVRLAILTCALTAWCHAQQRDFSGLTEVNVPASPQPNETKVILGARLIDGLGSPPIEDSVIVLRGSRIEAVGRKGEIEVPDDAEQMDASGLTVLPGLLDSHFHIGSGSRMRTRPAIFLANGVTAARDPGRPIDVYAPIVAANDPIPRLFLTGPHFDQAPPAYPDNAVLINSVDETTDAVGRYVDQGASAIKVYFRLPLHLISATCQTAHELGIPVTAHLEIVDADEGIAAGLDGIEHITSFGSILAEPDDAEKFQSAVLEENEARKAGRFRLWAGLNLEESPRVRRTIELIVQHGTYVSPTLAIFEKRAGDEGVQDYEVRGFEKMMKFVGMCHEAGATIVTGSHGATPRTEHGWAYQREMELLAESGLTPMEVIEASTIHTAQFLGCADRLGSIEAGKLADLVFVDGDPSKDIGVMYNVRRVMLGGLWVERPNG